jgi:predicted phosphate transport protein (TIGR00153 family)
MFGSNDKEFFDTFSALAEKIHAAAGLLLDMMRRFERPEESAHRIKALEHECDLLTHDLVKKLNRTFITPFDREDIHDLATKLDDVMDFIDNTANRMTSYSLAAPPPEMAPLADILHRQTGVLRDAVGNLKRTDHILEKCVEIHTLENEGDRIFHEGIARLFKGKDNAIEIIKHKDVLEALETATDKCEDAANVLEGILLKNA